MKPPPFRDFADLERMPAYARIAYLQLVELPGLRDTTSPETLAYLLCFLCQAYAEEERYAEAISTGRRALRIATEQASGDSALLGHVRLNLGVAHSQAGDLAQGLDSYLESWTHCRRADLRETLGKAGSNALLALESGQPTGERELAFLQECRAVFEAAGQRPQAARACGLLGAALLARGRAAEAVDALDRMLVLSESLGGARTMRRETVRHLQEADRLLTGEAGAPTLGPGVLTEVHALVADGVESLSRERPDRATTCFSRALLLLRRRTREPQRMLAAFLLLVLARLTWAQAADEDAAGAAAELLGRAGEEVAKVGKAQGDWVKLRAHLGDLDDLRQLAQGVAWEARRDGPTGGRGGGGRGGGRRGRRTWRRRRG
ncbi:tetratricopeptide repeat protein [Streptomyces sp. NRRL B-1347]|uniref:tetratricopeptide repeat protein n=1 Tax=Streptomyces sp. NRRL B-1347 TaxID=1476877 RepID=UPI0004CBC5A7|nr:tetratricopeptide repeat protein [Streptomyces sp. NRRL B-1347]